MKYAILNPDGSIAQACDDDTVTALPAGAVLMTDAQFAAWPSYNLDDESGELVYAMGSGPSFANQKTAFIRGFVADRERMIGRLAYLAGRAQRSNDLPKAAVCDALAEKLVALTGHITVTNAGTLDDLKAAMKTLYDAAVKAAIEDPTAPTLKDDFKRLDR